MASARKQQKLLGFGERWQDANPIVAIQREHEVRQALSSLSDLYLNQRVVQDGDSAECVAVLDVAQKHAQLVVRRGHVIESFGCREDGQWILALEEVLYLVQ